MTAINNLSHINSKRASQDKFCNKFLWRGKKTHKKTFFVLFLLSSMFMLLFLRRIIFLNFFFAFISTLLASHQKIKCEINFFYIFYEFIRSLFLLLGFWFSPTIDANCCVILVMSHYELFHDIRKWWNFNKRIFFLCCKEPNEICS